MTNKREKELLATRCTLPDKDLRSARKMQRRIAEEGLGIGYFTLAIL
jgi:hypothetical protein